MSENWQAGDLAMCINAGAWECEEGGSLSRHGPQMGESYLVVLVEYDVAFDELEDETYLVFDEWPGEAWLACRFIKINPQDPDEFDREIIAAMNDQPEQVPA
jgi:hypothetical protein